MQRPVTSRLKASDVTRCGVPTIIQFVRSGHMTMDRKLAESVRVRAALCELASQTFQLYNTITIFSPT